MRLCKQICHFFTFFKPSRRRRMILAQVNAQVHLDDLLGPAPGIGARPPSIKESYKAHRLRALEERRDARNMQENEQGHANIQQVRRVLDFNV
jgi:hypothetical protein